MVHGEQTSVEGAAPAAAVRPPIAALFQQLIDDATAFVRAEVALYRAQAGQKALSAGIAVGLIGGAIMLVQGAVVALLVGLMLALAAKLGIGWAIAVTVVGSILVAALLIKLGIDRIAALIEPEKPNP